MTQLSPLLILSIIVCHFLLLVFISYLTSKNAGNESFFVANRSAPWWLVAFGMIGTTVSGVTFISVPGAVGGTGLNQSFSYMQFVMGMLIGYAVVGLVLLPVYYRLNLISIYEYLEKRFGRFSYRTGAAFFLISRVIGASFRLYLMAFILQKFVLGALGVPFWATAIIVPFLIWAYTFKGGTKTVIWTDTIQTTLFVSALLLTLFNVADKMNVSFGELLGRISASKYAQIFFWDGGWEDPNNFFKQFFAGILIVIAMTGLDQDLMQKNLSCKNIKEAQKNMFTFSSVFIVVNLLFLTLGAALYILAQDKAIMLPEKTDETYPYMAFNHLSLSIGAVFMMGLVACSYSSADSALTSLTTSFCIDFLDFRKKQAEADTNHDHIAIAKLNSTRTKVHVAFTALLAVMILIFYVLNNDAVVNMIYKVAGYTYGPLLGLYVFGFMTKRQVNDQLVPYICIAAVISTYILDTNSVSLFGGFKFGFLNLALNAFLTIIGLWIFRKKDVH